MEGGQGDFSASWKDWRQILLGKTVFGYFPRNPARFLEAFPGERLPARPEFFEIRKAQLIDRTIFEKVYKDQLRERKRQMQTELVLEKAKSYEPVKKEYMRYQEAAEYFSMSMTCFKALAKEANSIRRIGNIVLINIDVVIDYIEENFGG